LYNFIKKLPIFLLLLLLVSCSDAVSVSTIDKSYSTDTVTVDAKIPQISGLHDEEFNNQVNKEYEKSITAILEDFKKKAAKTGDKSEFSVTTTEYKNDGRFFSAVTQVDYCAQSSHKSSFRVTKNIDVIRSVDVKLSDLFEGDEYIDMINARLESTVKENSGKYAGLWEKPRLLENQDFYITDKELVIYYQPYKLSYYERGFVEFPLSLADMSGYLKKEYQHLAIYP